MKTLPENYNYRPLPEGLFISASEIEGQGLFANKSFEKGINIGITHFKNDELLLRTPLGGFINHSDKPNCIITDEGKFDKPYFYLVTIRDIEECEEIVVDYYNSICGSYM